MAKLALLGLIFCPIPAAMAFLITYEEYQRHRLSRAVVLRRSCEAAVVTLIFFALLAVALGILVPAMIGAGGGTSV